MRTARLLTSALLAGGAVLGPAGSLAYADVQPGGSLELWPTSAPPGATVTANTTACGPAGHGTGDANAVGAGDFPMTASPPKDALAGQFEVAPHARPGSFRIGVRCENGKVVEARLTVTGAGEGAGAAGTERGIGTPWDRKDQQGHDKPWNPNDQQNQQNQQDHGKTWDPNPKGQHGRDKPWDPKDQHGRDKPWDVKDGQGHDKPWEGNDPHGHVKTGAGGSIRPDTTEIAVGAAVLAAAAVGGTWLLRRRASGTQGRG
ncbi:hypothetical protein ACGFW5_22030 [Streptomyces sp. NPDC048416]|uniref:hypothetical protein n=1 Tax=Streptomyces sp. NPDC048416 TaxID=3365546 RepID=UPI00372483DB